MESEQLGGYLTARKARLQHGKVTNSKGKVCITIISSDSESKNEDWSSSSKWTHRKFHSKSPSKSIGRKDQYWASSSKEWAKLYFNVYWNAWLLYTVLYGYPPKEVPISDPNATLLSLHIKTGETLILETRDTPVPIQTSDSSVIDLTGDSSAMPKSHRDRGKLTRK